MCLSLKPCSLRWHIRSFRTYVFAGRTVILFGCLLCSYEGRCWAVNSFDPFHSCHRCVTNGSSRPTYTAPEACSSCLCMKQHFQHHSWIHVILTKSITACMCQLNHAVVDATLSCYLVHHAEGLGEPHQSLMVNRGILNKFLQKENHTLSYS